MSGKPRTIPSASRNRHSTDESQQMPPAGDQSQAQKRVESGKAGLSTPVTASSTFASSSDSPTDENFVNDDIIEENSHVIPPTKKSGSRNAGKHGRK
ncbi:hypothetical protein [Roseimicrobium sp. ORNL1]|uniref:hypothetical protein n=1 Tax=Roseimicrobium sp. ORNL1 TaxID=2711231 RepID=UPI0013E17217|nr:hypothetical protein [Roseimicrobium sp. ORNL1]QIF02380.1 hypothetical protein G5S37_12885 [Roseimicrobium sp. ORNL1]